HQLPHFNEFLQRRDAEVIAEAKRRCRMKLGQAPGGPLGNRMRIRDELLVVRPSIPRSRISLAAFLNFQQRREQGQAGTCEGDWGQAEKDLWACYENAPW